MSVDFGFSIDGTTDTAKSWGIVGGIKNMGNAIVRRLTTDEGSLFYDLGYGYDTRNLLGAPLTDSVRRSAAKKIEDQCIQDERIDGAVASVQPSGTQEIKISLLLTLSDATSFTLVLSVNSLTVILLTAESA